MSKREIIGLVVIFLLVGATALFAYQLAGARYDRDVAEANVRALGDTVRIFRGEAESADERATVAATRFQEQREINSDSIRQLRTALGRASEQLRLRTRALTEAEVRFDRVQVSLDSAMVELSNVFSPQGRPERIAAFQKETDLVDADVVVTVSWDTAQSIEVELVAMVKPFDLTYSLGCSPENDAVATFEAPEGITATPRMGTVSPEICFGERPSLTSGFKLSVGNMFLRALIGGIAGVLIGSQF